MRVFISGIHSGPDPSPGVGLARSVREAFPHATVVGVDYSPTSTGIHSGVFDHVRVERPWDEIALDRHAQRIRTLLADSNTFWLSGLDVELDWIVHSVGPHVRLLLPPPDAHELTLKPEIRAAKMLGFRVPPSVTACSDPWTLHEFGRRHDWRLWVKGRHHDARTAGSPAELQATILRMQKDWDIGELFVQAHVPGSESCVAFAAHNGKLLGCVAIEKRLLTGQGKTWGAAVSSVERPLVDQLTTWVENAQWNGGGEIECVRDLEGQLWLIDFNPRFPAYIHGITLCGTNLPGRLLAAAGGINQEPEAARSQMFARVVWEVPASVAYPLPRIPEGRDGETVPGKHPSMQPLLANRLPATQLPQSPCSAAFSRPPFCDRIDARRMETTPSRISVPEVAKERLRHVGNVMARFERPAVSAAISVKTLPDRGLLEDAARHAWWAEVISDGEAALAKDAGFGSNRIVFNGVRKACHPNGDTIECAVVFHDSLASLQADIGPCTHLRGARLNLPGTSSRFGIRLDDPMAFSALVSNFRRAVEMGLWGDYGLHFHVASDTTGLRRWWHLLKVFLDWTERMAVLVGHGPKILDFGGGWFWDDFHDEILPRLGDIHRDVSHRLPDVTLILCEPGKTVSADAFALVTTVLDVREDCYGSRQRDAVVDASVADLPMAHTYPHRIAVCDHAGVPERWLSWGRDRILGATCMESDILAQNVDLPVDLASRDRLCFFDAGAYDASMAYHFGKGRRREES